MKVKVLVTQSYLTLCYPMDFSLPGSSVYGILQARILEWVAIPFSRGIGSYISIITLTVNVLNAPTKRHRLTEQMKTCACMHFHLSHHSAWPLKLYVIILWSEIAQSCPTLCDPVDCSLPGSSVHRIFQARVLEWVAFPSPGDLPNSGIEPWSLALQADALTSEPPGKPLFSLWHLLFPHI